MATEGPEDDAWLYGEDKKTEEPPAPGTEVGETPSQLSADAAPFEPKEGGKVNGAAEEADDKEEDESGVIDDDDDDDDSDDDVQVTIGTIKTQASAYETPKFKSGYQRPVAQQGPKPAAAKGVDVDAVGSINGVPLFEFDLDSVEDKPWRKPGADITDYFNYGFNEDTWSKYCEKQRRLRIDNNATGGQVFVTNQGTGRGGHRHQFHRHDYKPTHTTPDSHKPYYKQKYESPIHSQPTTINVIGSTNRDTRRPFQQEMEMNMKDETSFEAASQTPPPPGVPSSSTFTQVPSSEPLPASITVMNEVPVSMEGQAIAVAGAPLSVSITTQPPPQMVPTVGGYGGLPPTSVPPPGMVNIPPPNLQGPPPGMIGPPPGMIGPPPGFGPPPGANVPPPGFPGGPPPQGFGPPPGGMPGPPRGPPPGGYPGERPPFNAYPASGGPPRFGGPPPWERGRKERDWMDLPLSDDDLSPGSDDDRKRRRKYDRDRDRDRRRRSRSRDRDRRHRERDDRHRSRRDRDRSRERSRDDDRSRYSSRSYKESKSSKRDSEPLETKPGSPGP